MSRSRRRGSFSSARRISAPQVSGVDAGRAFQSGSSLRIAASVSLIVSPRKGAAARQHLEQDDAERPDVRAAIDHAATRLLGRHVGGGAEDDAGRGGLIGQRRRHRGVGRGPRRRARRAQRLGQAEVQHLDGAVGTQLDVGRLQIAVDDAVLVRELHGVGDLSRDGDGLVDGTGPARCGRPASGLRSAPAPGRGRGAAVARRLSSRPWMAPMLGWFSEASSCASRVKRASRSGSAPAPAGSRFSATSRCSRVSRARNTSPMPPAPRDREFRTRRCGCRGARRILSSGRAS